MAGTSSFASLSAWSMACLKDVAPRASRANACAAARHCTLEREIRGRSTMAPAARWADLWADGGCQARRQRGRNVRAGAQPHRRALRTEDEVVRLLTRHAGAADQHAARLARPRSTPRRAISACLDLSRLVLETLGHPARAFAPTREASRQRGNHLKESVVRPAPRQFDFAALSRIVGKGVAP